MSNAKVSKTDIEMAVSFSQDGLMFELLYAESLFRAESMELLLQNYMQTLQNMFQRPDIDVSQLQGMSKDEYELVTNTWNATTCQYPTSKCLHELVEEQAARTPDAVAVVMGSDRLTNAEKMVEVEKWSLTLKGCGVGPGSIVAILVDRSIDMIIGLLAVLVAGGAYAPIDSAYPTQRIQYILEDTYAPVLLTQSHKMYMVNRSIYI